MYLEFLKRKCCKASVVFGGYKDGLNTKDATHIRLRNGQMSNDIVFDENTLFSGSKEAFLCNEHNKQRFITVLSQGFETMHAKGDADCLMKAC